jgi:hypothetical protein
MYKYIPPRHLHKIGTKINNITILDFFIESGQLKIHYRCDCGNISKCKFHALSTSCKQCYYKRAGDGGRTHGLTRSPEYICWDSMTQRCFNPRSKPFRNYGGRGITVCERWTGRDGFINFLNDMGKRPGLKYSIERINNNGNYEPSNCKWATQKEQLANKRQGDGIYRIHNKICSVCKTSFKGYYKNLYCSRACQMIAYRNRKKRQAKLKTSSSSKTSSAEI